MLVELTMLPLKSQDPAVYVFLVHSRTGFQNKPTKPENLKPTS